MIEVSRLRCIKICDVALKLLMPKSGQFYEQFLTLEPRNSELPAKSETHETCSLFVASECNHKTEKVAASVLTI